MAAGRRFDSAPDGHEAQDQCRARRLFGERQAVTERDRDRALLEIQSAMNPRGWNVKKQVTRPRFPDSVW